MKGKEERFSFSFKLMGSGKRVIEGRLVVSSEIKDS